MLLMAFLVYGVPISVVVSIIMLVPMTLVWNVAFRSVRKTSDLQLRATFASGISALIGVAFCIVLFVQLTEDVWRTVSVLLPASMLPVFVAMVLTWNTFGNVQEAKD